MTGTLSYPWPRERMAAVTQARFPNPCPVCGSADEHAQMRQPPYINTCPHEEQPGHGTGCTCMGVSEETYRGGFEPHPWRDSASGAWPGMVPITAPAETVALEQRVAALEAGMATLLAAALSRGDITVNGARAALGLAPMQMAVPEPDFMKDVRTDAFRDTGLHAVRLTHLPTGLMAEAPARDEAAVRLGRKLLIHAQHGAGIITDAEAQEAYGTA